MHINLPTKHMVPGLQWFNFFHAATAITQTPQLTPFFAQGWFVAYSGSAAIANALSNESMELPPHSILTKAQQELLCVHQHLGHINFAEIQ